MEDNKSYKYVMPLITLIGKDALSKLGFELNKKEVKKALIVTDSFMSKSKIIDSLINILKTENIEYKVFHGVKSNPTIEIAKDAVNDFINNNCDSIISLGGGSAHDTAKAMKLVFLNKDTKNVNLIAINTTAGTGSEITKFCIITDEENHHKLAVVDERVIPDIAVDDPKLMLDMPKGLTAATGMDALTHAIEAFTSKNNNKLTDCTSIEAIKLIFESLKEAYINGNNLEARENMVYAQYLAAMSFSNAGLGLVHAMSHQLSGLYNLPHGICNAILLPYVMEYNFDVNFKRYALIARRINIATKGLSDNMCAKKLIIEVNKLKDKLNICRTIKELNVKEEDINLLSKLAIKDPCSRDNSKSASIDDIKKIYIKAYKG